MYMALPNIADTATQLYLSRAGLVTWGTTALIIGWLTGFFGLFGLPSEARLPLVAWSLRRHRLGLPRSRDV